MENLLSSGRGRGIAKWHCVEMNIYLSLLLLVTKATIKCLLCVKLYLRNLQHLWKVVIIFFLFFSAVPAVWGISQATDWTHTTAVTQPLQWQCLILNQLHHRRTLIFFFVYYLFFFFFLKETKVVPLRLSRLKIQCCHFCGSDLIPGLGISAFCGCGQKGF